MGRLAILPPQLSTRAMQRSHCLLSPRLLCSGTPLRQLARRCRIQYPAVNHSLATEDLNQVLGYLSTLALAALASVLASFKVDQSHLQQVQTICRQLSGWQPVTLSLYKPGMYRVDGVPYLVSAADLSLWSINVAEEKESDLVGC